MKTRNLKVREDYYEYQLKGYERPAPVPTLLLKGYWLQQVGIFPGQQVKVTLTEQGLLISPVGEVS